MSAGRFITLEGIEGAGKSTVARLLRDALSRRGLEVILTREPGGTPLAERVRQVVLERQGENVSPAAETLLMFAARAIHLDNLIRPALERGAWVICDRFTDATRAYQGAGRGVSRDWIEQLAREVHQRLEPDRTLLLDLPVEEGLARARQRSGAVATDRFEEESVQFFERVRAGYHSLARSAPERIRIIDASRPLPEVEQQALAALADLIK
ncbi:MAG TPA: dTMP kinase [Steroidobacteraceae bacterium]